MKTKKNWIKKLFNFKLYLSMYLIIGFTLARYFSNIYEVRENEIMLGWILGLIYMLGMKTFKRDWFIFSYLSVGFACAMLLAGYFGQDLIIILWMIGLVIIALKSSFDIRKERLA